MTKVIRIDGIDRTDAIRQDTWQFADSAYRGETAIGGFDFDDPAAAVDIVGHRPVIATESAQPDRPRIFTGYTVERRIHRGPFRISSDRQWGVDVIDANTLLDDRVIRTADGDRPAETDVARVTWLLGSGYLPLDDEGVISGSTVTLDAVDFRGRYPRDVMDDAAEQSGKNYFVYYDQNLSTNALWYDLATSSNYQSPLRISTLQSDVSGTTFPPDFPSLQRQADPARVYSGVRVEYMASGSNSANAFFERGDIVTGFRRREITIYDQDVTSLAAASNLADKYLSMASTERDTIDLDVALPAHHVNSIVSGHRIGIKAPHLGVPSFTNYRVASRTVRPRGTEGASHQEYTLSLKLTLPKITRFSGRGTKHPETGTGGGGATIGDAELSDGASTNAPLTATYYESDRATAVQIGGRVCSYVYFNTAYTVSGCAIGCGGWSNWIDQETWHQFTAPADADQLGLSVTFTAGTATGVGTSSPLLVGWARKATASGAYLDWTPVQSMKNVTQTIYIPRSMVLWGAVNSIILAPSWRCARGAFICDEELALQCQAYGPGSVGHFGSGTIDIGSGNGGTLVVKPRSFTSGTTGYAPWVGAVGNVDGSNQTFRLVSWDGTGKPEARVNGIRIPESSLTYDTSAKTVSLPFAPESGNVPLFRYVVAA